MADEIGGIVVRITGDASGLQSTIEGVKKELGSIEGAITGTGKTTEKATRQMASSWEQAGKGITDVGKSINTITKPVQVAGAAFAAGGVAAAKFAIDFEDSFAGVKKTVEGTPEQLDKIKKAIIDMSTVGINGHSAIPMTTAELNELAAAGGQLGIQTENIADFTETIAMLGTATNLVGEEGAKTLARFMNVTNTGQEYVSNLGSAIVELGNNFATSEAEIASMAMNMGNTGRTVGMTAQEILAYATVLSSFGMEAAAGGSAVSRIWMDLNSAVAKGGKALDSYAKTAGVSSKEFQKAWKDDASKAFSTFVQGLAKDESKAAELLLDMGFNNIKDQNAMLSLGSSKGQELLVNALEMSNKAWEENTALQEEFSKRAETTASKIQVLKQNIVEAGRSIGETFLPSVVSGTETIANFAKKLSELSDEQKKTVVNVGTGVIAFGMLSKGVASSVVGIGNVVSAVGKIKTALGAGGVLSSIAPKLASIATAAGPAGIGIAAVGTALIGAKVAYDAWYRSNYKFADGMAETANATQNATKRYKELNDLQREYNDLSGKINSKALSGGELDSANARLEDIKKILQEEYSIDVNSSDIDEALDKAKELEKVELIRNKQPLRQQVNDTKDNFINSQSELIQLGSEYKKATDAAEQYNNAINNIVIASDKWNKDASKTPQYLTEIKDVLSSVGQEKLLSDYEKVYGQDYSRLSSYLQLRFGSLLKGLDIEDKKKKLDDLRATIDEFKKSAQSLADVDLMQFEDAFKNGDDFQSYFDEIAELARIGAIDGSSFASEIAKIQSGVTDLSATFNAGGQELQNFVLSYINNMHEFGKSDAQITEGINAIAQAIGFLPEGKEIKIDFTTGKIDITEAEKPVNGTINYTAGKFPTDADVPRLRGTVTYNAVFNNAGVVGARTGGKIWPQAKGTQNFSGGMALVNDDGTADPRELIIDRGNAYIPNGRNVILPLSKGAKVYTSSQTQAIMRGLGIPRYAGGKDNSEGFITARDNWSHYTKTHAVTTTEELEHWLEMQKQYASNEKDIADIEEQVFSLRVKQMSEFNKNSENWLAHEEKYNNLTAEGYIEGLERMKISQKEYFNQGLISWDEYSQEVQSLNDRIADKHKEAAEKVKEENAEIFSSWQNDADMWERMRSTYGDWDKYGDSEEQFYKRKIDRIKEFYAQGIISFEDYDKAVKEASMDLYESQSNGIDEMLSAQYQTIQDLRQKFSDEEKALQDSWAVSDRRADMTDVKAQMGIYQNAVTTRGQEKYKELQEQLKSLQREEQLYNLQTKNNAIIKSLEEEYRYAEANKGVLLDNLRSSSIDISSWTRALNDNVSISTANIGNTLNAILKAIGDKEINVYNDNSNKNTINLSNGMQVMFSGGRYLYYGM